MHQENRGVRLHPGALFAMLLMALVLAGTITLRQTGVSVRVGRAVGQTQHAVQQSDKELYYSTMHPWIVQDHPGSCPICGMELVEMPADMQTEWEHNNKQA
jgi:Cu(I)/Ag(I) efflux system membrane fusion protein